MHSDILSPPQAGVEEAVHAALARQPLPTDAGRAAEALVQRLGRGVWRAGEEGVDLPCVFRLQDRTRRVQQRSEEHTSELQSLMRISYAVFCLKKKTYQSQKTEPDK